VRKRLPGLLDTPARFSVVTRRKSKAQPYHEEVCIYPVFTDFTGTD